MAKLACAISASRKKRAILQASLTKLCTRVTKLQSRSEDSFITNHAEQSLSRLKQLDSNSLLTREQDVLDTHDEIVAEFLVKNLFACSCVKPVHGPIVKNKVNNFMVKTE